MKKIFFAIVMMAMALSANAQPKEKADFKAGKNSLEIGFNPFNNSWDEGTFRIDELKYRRFFGNHALRVGLGIDISSQKRGDIYTYNKDEDEGRLGSKESYTKANQTKFSIAAGYEYHFNVAPRVSLYAGGELGYIGFIGNKITTYVDETWTKYDDENKIVSSFDASTDIKTKGEGNTNAFYANILAGMDFHVYRGLYLGAEIKLGYIYTKYSDGLKEGTELVHEYNSKGNLCGGHEYTYATDGGRQTVAGYNINSDGEKTEYSEVIADRENLNSDQNFKLDVAGALRIGYRF